MGSTAKEFRRRRNERTGVPISRKRGDALLCRCRIFSKLRQHDVAVQLHLRRAFRSTQEIRRGPEMLEDHMEWSGSLTEAARLAAVGLCLLLWAGKAAGQSGELAGEYVCAEAHVAGKTVPCKAAPLSLKSDGRFELQ